LAELVAAKAPRGRKTAAKEQLEEELFTAEAMRRNEPSYQLKRIKETNKQNENLIQ
jgi:hypothetical protein